MKKGRSRFTKFLGKFWSVVWKDDSFRGWVLSIIFLIILIRGVILPAVSLAAGLGFFGNPLVIVESCSMYHKGDVFSNFGFWWQNHEFKYLKENISKEDFFSFDFKKGFNKGDILFIRSVNPAEVKVGDVIIFDAGGGNPIIHRVVGITSTEDEIFFSTMGDNNNGQLPFEKSIHESRLIGTPQFLLIPYAGWIKLVFFEGARSPQERGFCSEN